MKIAHVALWSLDIETLAAFWVRYFGARIGEKYISQNRPGFTSRFVTLTEGPTIELMSLPALESGVNGKELCGWAHIALNVGDKTQVDRLAKQANEQGILVSGPRMTGDGFYEAVLKDPDGNLIEITAE